MDINSLKSLRKEHPEQFWGILSHTLLEECDKLLCDDAYLKKLADARIKFLNYQKENKPKPFPYHQGYRIEKENFQFRFFIQMIAQTENEILKPMPILIGVRRLDKENYYTFHLLDNGKGENEIEIFPPHFIDQYARRAPRFGKEKELYNVPDTWPRQTTTTPNEKDEYQDLFTLIAMFFGHNKINYLSKNSSALSRKKQKEGSNEMTTLWMDGISYCEHYCYEHTNIWLHKTFLPYFKDDSTIDDDYLGEDQFQAIAPDLNLLFKDASNYFPNQYKTGNIGFINMIPTHHIIDAIDAPLKKMNIQFIIGYCKKFFEDFEVKDYIAIKKEYKQPPRFKSEDLKNAKQILSNFCNSTEQSINEEIALSLLRRWSYLYWKNEEYLSWYSKPYSLDDANETSEIKALKLRRRICIISEIKNEIELLSKSYSILDKIMSNNK